MKAIAVAREFDSPWKEALELFFEPLLRLFFPDLHAAIDWSKGYESLDAELQQIVREAELGPALADKLFRVTLLNGEDVWLLIHVEVQAQPDPDFERRMFIYYYRIFDRYNRDVVGLAILADDAANWRPDEYSRERFGCRIGYRFRSVKLLDWAQRIKDLTNSENPIALFVVAHLESLLTHGKPDLRFEAKRRLLCRLVVLGWTPEQIRRVYRLIDWLLELPRDLETRFRNDIDEFAKEKQMPRLSFIEREAREEGRQEGRQEGMKPFEKAWKQDSERRVSPFPKSYRQLRMRKS